MTEWNILGAMFRRDFLSSIMTMPLVLSETGGQPGPQGGERPASPDVLAWSQYSLRNGPQPRRLADYLQNAAIPAWNRQGVKPVGVFEAVFGVPSQTVFVLAPFATPAALFGLESALDKDEQFAAAGAAFANTPATDPPFVRQEVSLLTAFPQMPKVQVPAATAAKGPRLFELRTYESPSERGHRMKVKMFAEMGEIDIFKRVGLTPVFFARTTVGPRMPSLVYMLVHENMAAREKAWDAFRTDPEWRKLSATPGYSDAEIVSNITTVFLRPAGYSQI
jgi:hypothetical protein